LFDVERVNAQGEDIPGQVEDTIFTALFDPTTFEKSVLQIARDSGVVGDVLDMLYEPPPSPDSTAIPFVGDTRVYESIMGMAARGLVALNVDGTWIGRTADHNDDEQAFRFIRSRAFRSGSEMR